MLVRHYRDSLAVANAPAVAGGNPPSDQERDRFIIRPVFHPRQAKPLG